MIVNKERMYPSCNVARHQVSECPLRKGMTTCHDCRYTQSRKMGCTPRETGKLSLHLIVAKRNISVAIVIRTDAALDHGPERLEVIKEFVEPSSKYRIMRIAHTHTITIAQTYTRTHTHTCSQRQVYQRILQVCHNTCAMTVLSLVA